MKRQYQKRGFEVIGISMDDGSQEQIEEFVRQYEINYPVVMGAEARLDAFGKINGLPISFLIDREGRIHSRHQGLLGLNEIETELPKLLTAK
jgi:cytochrome c biogenesis protein CcmG/thiol:disulfide interchange protein DsbE